MQKSVTVFLIALKIIFFRNYLLSTIQSGKKAFKEILFVSTLTARSYP